jgi:hypothetical protein
VLVVSVGQSFRCFSLHEIAQDRFKSRAGVTQLEKEARQTREHGVAKDATQRAARPDPSLRKSWLARDDNQADPPRIPRGSGLLRILHLSSTANCRCEDGSDSNVKLGLARFA